MRLLAGVIVTTFFAAALPVDPAIAVQAAAAAETLARANKKLDKGDYKAAVKLFAEADRAAEGRSVQAVAGLTKAQLALNRFDEAIAGAKRWVALADSPARRAAGNNHLGFALLRRGVAEVVAAHVSYRDRESSMEEPGMESLRGAAAAFRSAAAEANEGRHLILLSLAESLVLTKNHAEALQVLDEYAAGGGEDPRVADLRCWAERASVQSEAPGSDVHRMTGEVQAPVKLFAPQPAYTTAARKAGVQGTLYLQAIIDEHGAVTCARALQGMPYGLTEAGLVAVKSWKFRPARLEGRTVPVFYSLQVTFSLEH